MIVAKPIETEDVLDFSRLEAESPAATEPELPPRQSIKRETGKRPCKLIFSRERIQALTQAAYQFANAKPDFDTGENILLSDFCHKNRILRDELYSAALKDEELSKALSLLKNSQEAKLSKELVKSKRYAPIGIIFALKNVCHWNEGKDANPAPTLVISRDQAKKVAKFSKLK